MRWEDERYVRLYTRNTPEWLALSWQARGILGLVLRELDRAGILKVGKLGLKGVAVAITAPWAEIEGPLAELLEDGCLRFDPDQGRIWMPNFIEAQEAVQSDAARKRASRERARALLGVDSTSAGEATIAVTSRDHRESRGVPSESQNSAPASHSVTSGHAQSLCAVPSVPSQSLAVLTAPAASAGVPVERKAKSNAGSRGTRIAVDWKPSAATLVWCHEQGVDGEAHVEEFVDFWRAVSGAKGVKLDWDLVFKNRIRELVKRDQAEPWEGPPPEQPKVGPRPEIDRTTPEWQEANRKIQETLDTVFARKAVSV